MKGEKIYSRKTTRKTENIQEKTKFRGLKQNNCFSE